MRTSKAGIELIKRFEGCRLTAYKPIEAERYYTIGYGHYGPDIYDGMKITQAQADALLIEDLKKFEDAVRKTNLALTQNQFDALVSFAYNCGAGSLQRGAQAGGRSAGCLQERNGYRSAVSERRAHRGSGRRGHRSCDRTGHGSL